MFFYRKDSVFICSHDLFYYICKSKTITLLRTYGKKVQEYETKNILKKEYFAAYDWTKVIGKIDLTVQSNPVFGTLPTPFQSFKTTEKGKRIMNSTSEDARYTELLADLRQKQKALEARIDPKIYEHGFLL